MPGPKPGPTSSQLRFSNENTITDRYRAGGAGAAPHGVVLVATGALVAVVVVAVVRGAWVVGVAREPELDPHAARSSAVVSATAVRRMRAVTDRSGRRRARRDQRR